MKKVTSIIIAIAMILITGTTAWAATIGESGIVSFDNNDRTITIKKQLTAFNPAGSTVNAPAITYNYTIESGTAGKTVKDVNNISTSTLAGPAGATITESISWNPSTTTDQLTTSEGGKENIKTITVDFTNVTFSSAGVYRYKITESATYTNTGVTDGGSHIRYLDVYVKNGTTAGQFDVYAYVLFANDNTIDGTETDSVTAAVKTEGFIGSSADKYYTYNLTISKILSGDEGMATHQFPFSLTFSGNETSVLPIFTASGNSTISAWTNATAGTMASFNVTAASGQLKIANGGVVTVTGIPIGTSAVISETNDVTGTTYSVASSGADVQATTKSVSPNESSNTATVNAQTSASINDKNVVFTNTLTLISPTGYVARYAPYGLMLIAGIALLVVAMKRKKHSDEE